MLGIMVSLTVAFQKGYPVVSATGKIKFILQDEKLNL